MIIGLKHLTWAKFASGGDGSAVTYTGGKMEKDLMVRADQSEERTESGFYADDHMIDRDNSVTSASISLEMAKLTEDMYADMFGHQKLTGTDKVWRVTDAEAPYVGVGFVQVARHSGQRSWRACWYYKVQFSEGNRSFNTKGESIDFQTESAEGTAMSVQMEENGASVFYDHGEFTSEAAAIAWLKTQAGISA